jgi:hypothetical protein
VEGITWAKGFDVKTGKPIETGNRPPEAKAGADKGDSVFVSPPFLGGTNWMPMSYSPDTGLFYIPANHWAMDYWTEQLTYKAGSAYLGQGFRIKRLFDDHVGTLRAIDPKTGKIAWEHKEKFPLWAGTLTTAGGLLFTGTSDGYVKAFDAKTARSCGSSRPAPAWSPCPSPGKWTASSTSACPPATAARCPVGRRHGRPDQAGHPGLVLLGLQAAQVRPLIRRWGPGRLPRAPPACLAARRRAPGAHRRPSFPSARRAPHAAVFPRAALAAMASGCSLPAGRCASESRRAEVLAPAACGPTPAAGAPTCATRICRPATWPAPTSPAPIWPGRPARRQPGRRDLRRRRPHRRAASKANAPGASFRNARLVGPTWSSPAHARRLHRRRPHRGQPGSGPRRLRGSAARLTNANLQETKFNATNLRGANLEGAAALHDLPDSTFEGCTGCPTDW